MCNLAQKKNSYRIKKVYNMYIQQIFYANITLSFILKNQKLFTRNID